MKSTEEHPFAFFDWYLEHQINKDLKEFYVNITEELYYNNADIVDNKKHIIKVLNIHHKDEFKSEYLTFSFEGFTKPKLIKEITLTKNFIELNFQKRFSNKNDVKGYADFLRIKIDSFLKNKTVNEFSFVTSYFEDLYSLIDQYSKQEINSSNPLLFYTNMLFVNSIKSVKDSFIGNSTLKENQYSYIQPHNCYLKEELIEGDNIEPFVQIEEIKKEDFLERLLTFENISIYNKIENDISSYDNKKVKTIYLENIFNELQALLKRARKLEDDSILLIEDKLLEIIDNLKDRYSSIVTYHEVYKYLIKEMDITYFNNKDLKYSFYVDLYELAYNLDIIDDTKIEEQDFINAFTSSNPQTLSNKIIFSKNNYIVSYFLESLKPFFNGFTHSAIEKSTVFLNKQNKPLKSTDIYTSLSRGKNKIIDEKSQIDAQILKLKNKYLK